MAEMKKNTTNSLDKLVHKINQCIDYQSLYALEEEFNKSGFSVQTTASNKMILCKLVGGKILAENVVDDYIFIGSNNTSTNELSDRATMKICDFVRNNAGSPSTVMNIARVWRNGIRVYESSVKIVNEDINQIADRLIIE
jgi:hypothetical protein